MNGVSVTVNTGALKVGCGSNHRYNVSGALTHSAPILELSLKNLHAVLRGVVWEQKKEEEILLNKQKNLFLKNKINPLIENCLKLLSDDPLFFIINT